MSTAPIWLTVLPVLYAVSMAVIAVVAYLVIRFAIRDGMKGHTLWLERRRPPS